MPKPSESEAVASPWTPFREAVRQAGSVDALVAALREGRVFARHGGLYVNGAPWRPGNFIPSDWWTANAVRDIDPKAGRATWIMDVLGVPIPVVVVGIEVEPAALSAVFPIPPFNVPAILAPSLNVVVLPAPVGDGRCEASQPASKRPSSRCGPQRAKPRAAPGERSSVVDGRAGGKKGAKTRQKKSERWRVYAKGITVRAKPGLSNSAVAGLIEVQRAPDDPELPGRSWLEKYVAQVRKELHQK
jgi:hypothetical protein